MTDKVITCPRCGYQYLPAEIYVPKYFFGKPKYIRRDAEGRIFSISGTKEDYEELYKCDNCNTSFKVVANVQFETIIDDISDTEYLYETKLDK